MSQNFSYYHILIFSYGSALLGWWLLNKYSVSFWKDIQTTSYEFEKPWIEFLTFFLLCIAIVLIGQLYSAGLLIPEFNIGVIKVAEILNQVLIYSPIPLYLIIRKQPLSSAFLPKGNVLPRLGVGLGLSLIATVVFGLLAGKKSLANILPDVYNLKNTHYAIQIFLEDLGIGFLLFRLIKITKTSNYIFVIAFVGFLFAAGHLPVKLQAGTPVLEAFIDLLMDMGITMAVAMLLSKSKDILWFFPIHFVMDMMQFYSGLDLK